MINPLIDMEKKGIYLSVFISIIVIFVSGLFFGLTYFVMDTVDQTFRTTDCEIKDNVFVESCQDLFGLALYPFLALKSVLIWSSFFFMFGLVFSLLLIGYRSGSSPVMLGVMVTFVAGMTYFAIMLGNIYRSLVDVAIFRDMMIPFTVYNKIMLNFPWFIFFVGLFSVILGIVNFQKTSINKIEGDEVY